MVIVLIPDSVTSGVVNYLCGATGTGYCNFETKNELQEVICEFEILRKLNEGHSSEIAIVFPRKVFSSVYVGDSEHSVKVSGHFLGHGDSKTMESCNAVFIE